MNDNILVKCKFQQHRNSMLSSHCSTYQRKILQ
nr:MAG TPA: hypothetical protein [Caudoviricetes sp.]